MIRWLFSLCFFPILAHSALASSSAASPKWASSYWESTRDQVRLTVPEEPATEDAYDDDDGWLDYKAFFSGGMEGNWRGSLFQGKGGVFF